MTANTPDTITLMGDYDTLRQRVVDAAHDFGLEDPSERELTTPELSSVILLTSQGVLRQLQEEGVAEAGTLAIKLGHVVDADELADLSYTVSEHYAAGESSVDANAQAQYQRMARLAKAAGKTAGTIVNSVLKPENVSSVAADSRNAVLDYRITALTKAGADLLNGLIMQAEQA